MHFFFNPGHVLENRKYVGIFGLHSLEKRFQTAKKRLRGLFPASNLPRGAVSASHAAHFCEPFGYVDGRCRKCRQFRNTTRPGQVFGGPPTSFNQAIFGRKFAKTVFIMKLIPTFPGNLFSTKAGT